MKASIERLYYSITEVSKLLDEEQHVLRYWEREFQQLRPQKNRAGNRVYSEKDIAILKVIRKLLREERYTVAGAREYLRQHGVQEEIDHENLIAAEGDGSLLTPSIDEKTDLDRPAVIRELAGEIREIAGTLRQKTSRK
ncbi:MAG: MerR family transcriptional regulator [Ignavibacteria bacterium]|nr:MerR family transcriptional regulator [Ignavibacteria bacterium]